MRDRGQLRDLMLSFLRRRYLGRGRRRLCCLAIRGVNLSVSATVGADGLRICGEFHRFVLS